jgi:hypothetical protein
MNCICGIVVADNIAYAKFRKMNEFLYKPGKVKEFLRKKVRYTKDSCPWIYILFRIILECGYSP